MLGSGFAFPPPYHYSRSAGLFVTFETDPSAIRDVIPPCLELGDRHEAFVRATKHAHSPFGPYLGVYLGVYATYQGAPVQHILSGIKSSAAGTFAAREIWGMPYRSGENSLEWHDEILHLRAGVTGERAECELRLQLIDRRERTAEPPMLRTHSARVPDFDRLPSERALIAVQSELDRTGVEEWNAVAAVTLSAESPLDDWTTLPVRRVTGAVYETGGQITLPIGRVLERWKSQE